MTLEQLALYNYMKNISHCRLGAFTLRECIQNVAVSRGRCRPNRLIRIKCTQRKHQSLNGLLKVIQSITHSLLSSMGYLYTERNDLYRFILHIGICFTQHLFLFLFLYLLLFLFICLEEVQSAESIYFQLVLCVCIYILL